MHALWIPSGIVIWALHFSIIYGLTGLACARGYGQTIPGLVAISSAIAASVAAVVVAKGFRRRSAFIGWMSASIAAFALIAIVYETVAALLTPSCD
jgi:hypothetical protein